MPQSLQKKDFGGRRAAVLGGIRRAAGVPAIVIGASFVGFGALVHQTGLSIWHALFSTATGWAQPGQVALFELYGLGASILVISAAVTLTSVRLLPMAVTFMPLVRSPGTPRWLYYLAANWVAVTTWAFAMRDCPRLPAAQRLPYFMGFACTLWGVTLATTACGFALAGAVPLPVTLGLVFINPIYFMLMTAADVRSRARVLAVLLGAAGGPALYLLTPDWSLLLAGVGAGSLGFLLGGGFRRRSSV
jgi:predicted branched-subunit amino acid permease